MATQERKTNTDRSTGEAESATALPPTTGSAPRRNFAPVTATTKLAFWQLRQAWRLLLVIGLGIVASVILVCVVPLYSQVAMTAGLRGILTASPQNADIVVTSNAAYISSAAIDKSTQALNVAFQKQLGPYVLPAQFSMQTQAFTLLTSGSGKGGSTRTLHPTRDGFTFTSASMDQAAAHVRMIAGRLPRTSSDDLEIALTPDNADLLQVAPGSVLYVGIQFYDQNGSPILQTVPVHVVGIFKLAQEDDPFWHGNDFSYFSPNDFQTFYSGLVSNSTSISVLNRISDDANAHGFYQNNFFGGFFATLYWYYRLNISNISVNHLDEILNGFQTVKIDNANNPTLAQYPYMQQTRTYLSSGELERYSSRIAVAQFPVLSLLALVLGLVLFFVTAMANLLVDRQTGAIALLRSRGASRQQVFGSLVIQSISLGLLALVAGPLLAIPLTRLLVQHTLPPADQGALNVLDGNPLLVAFGLRWYILAAVAVTIGAMIAAVRSTMRLDVLALRREAARSTRIPLFLRLNLDIIAAVLALAGYGFSFYLTNSLALNPQIRLLLLSPLTLLESLFLLLACMLLFLRIFPRLLQLGANTALHSRGAAPLIALAQMARTPRQSVRMTLLLALATALAIFTLIFTASQTQRILDVANYQAGADFSGNTPANNIFFNTSDLPGQTAQYQRVHGVISATLGYITPVTAGTQTLSIPIHFEAIDADTFARTAIWTQQDSSQSLASLMAQLTLQRSSAITRKVVPAILDADAWNALHLSLGAPFKLNFAAAATTANFLNFTAVAQVQHIPTPTGSTDPTVLVDYQSFAAAYSPNVQSKGFYAPMNYVWVRSHDDPASLASVRKALTDGSLQLTPLYDRRNIITNLSNDPLYLTLIGVLTIGAATAILLALIGNLVASWLSARTRLTNFAVLRALGSNRRQIASVLTWEQCIVYTTALGLGLIFGILLSAMALSALVFTTVPNSGVNGTTTTETFYAVQSVPPVQMVIPSSLEMAIIILIAICAIAIAMMVQIVSKPSMSQVLRLNED